MVRAARSSGWMLKSWTTRGEAATGSAVPRNGDDSLVWIAGPSAFLWNNVYSAAKWLIPRGYDVHSDATSTGNL